MCWTAAFIFVGVVICKSQICGKFKTVKFYSVKANKSLLFFFFVFFLIIDILISYFLKFPVGNVANIIYLYGLSWAFKANNNK